MKIKPGYRTTEHALVWAVVLLGIVALLRSRTALDHLAAVLGPALASAAYSHSRGRAKAVGPFVVAGGPALSLAQQLAQVFRGRIVS